MNQINLNQITKRFNRSYLFTSIEAQVKTNEVLVITGKNGSGKSTLIKIVAGLLNSTSGSVDYTFDKNKISSSDLKGRSGFVAPYYNLFNQLTAYDNLEIFNKSLTKPIERKQLLKLFAQYQLDNKALVKVRQYSSGMKQRLRLLIATMNQPDFLLMDEPTSNLDLNGKELVNEIIVNQRKIGPIVICTNETDEIKWGTNVIEL